MSHLRSKAPVPAPRVRREDHCNSDLSKERAITREQMAVQRRGGHRLQDASREPVIEDTIDKQPRTPKDTYIAYKT